MPPVTAASFALTSALWLTLLPSASFAQTAPDLSIATTSEQARIFLNAGNLTTVEPLFLSFHPQQITLEEENMEILRKWLEKIKKSDVPIHIYSYATPPTARMDMTPQSAHHIAMRKAFNRALEAKNALQSQGIEEKYIALHAIGPADDNRSDQLRITLRQN